jgi:hypothetical protein
MHQTDYLEGPHAIASTISLQVQAWLAKFSDTCCWEQILKILEENGFGRPHCAPMKNLETIGLESSSNF